MKYRKQTAYILSVILITGLLSGAILASAHDMLPYSEESSFGRAASGSGIEGIVSGGSVVSGEPASSSAIATVTPSAVVSSEQPSVTPSKPSVTPSEPSVTSSEPSVTPSEPSVTPSELPSETPDTPSISPSAVPSAVPAIKINVNVKNTFIGVKAGKKATAALSVKSLTDAQGKKLKNTKDYAYTWYAANKNKDKKVGSKQTYKPAVKQTGLYEYYCQVTNAKTKEVLGNSETVTVVGYAKNLSVTLPKNKKGGVSSVKMTSDIIRNQLLGIKKKDAKSIVIHKAALSKKADKTNKKNLAVKNKSVKVKTFLKGKKAKKALTITVKDTKSKKEFTIKDITVESKLKELPAGNVTMKLSQKNTLLTVTFKKVKGISYIRFGPTGKKPAKLVKKANKSAYVAKFRNRSGFKSKEFQIALGYKTKYGVQYSSYVKKKLKSKKKK